MSYVSGPWTLSRFNPDRCTVALETVERGYAIPEEGYALGVLYSCGANDATPRLIAAAPDLIEAVRFALESELEPSVRATLADALAKAEGKI